MAKKNDKRNLIIGLIIIIILAIVAFWIFKKNGPGEAEVGPPIPHKIRGGPCPGEVKEFTQDDVYMRGLLEQGQKFKVIMNYYDCNPPKKGDLVLFSFSDQMQPVVKVIRAVQGDKYKLTVDKKYHAWDIWINGEQLFSLTNPSQPYFMGTSDSKHPLHLYEGPRKGVLQQNEVILLSSFPPGDKDSGIFGLFNLVDVLGKVEPEGGSGQTQ
jgi:hypothetical protein